MGHVSQIVRFLLKRVDDHHSQALEISEGQLDLPLLRPGTGGRN